MNATLQPGLPTDYYAPTFTVEIEDEELDPASKGDVLDIKVVLDRKDLTSAELKFNNYDDTTFELKWSDKELFELGNRIHVQLGYADRQVSVLKGLITSLSPEFPSNGPPTLSVRAMDAMFRLKGSKPPNDECTYRNMRDSEIAVQVAQRNHLRWKVDEQGPKHEVVVQPNQDDATFLKERAARIDFDVFMRTDPDTGEDILHFVNPKDGRDDAPLKVYELQWGTRSSTSSGRPSLIEFTPTITGADQVKSVTIRGWDPVRKEPIIYTATPGQTAGVGSGDQTGPAAAERLATEDGKQEVIVDAPVMSVEEAERLAKGELAKRSYEYLTGKGRVIGLPDLRPGDNVQLDGLGKRFSGLYYVTKVTHSLGNSGFTSEFEVRKTYDGGSK